MHTSSEQWFTFLIVYHFVINKFLLFSFYSSGIWEKAYAGFMKQLER